jgi:hypothetical protein
MFDLKRPKNTLLALALVPKKAKNRKEMAGVFEWTALDA